jgi:hypothetical protein
MLNKKFRREAEELLIELEYRGRFEVGLIPVEEPKHSGHKQRAVFVANPEWYQDFCSRYSRPTPKKDRLGRPRYNRTPNFNTVINRRETIASLQRLIEHGEVRTIYDERLRDFIKERLDRRRNEATKTGRDYSSQGNQS